MLSNELNHMMPCLEMLDTYAVATNSYMIYLQELTMHTDFMTYRYSRVGTTHIYWATSASTASPPTTAITEAPAASIQLLCRGCIAVTVGKSC